MEQLMLDKIKLYNLKEINLDNGNVMRALKKSDDNFYEFGEIYFSWIRKNKIKAWKYHLKMFINFIVPIGDVLFVFYDEKNDKFKEIIIGQSNYARLVVPPKIWFGFKCISDCDSLVVNIASIEHDDKEVLKKEITKINYEW